MWRLHLVDCNMEVATDASDLGWGLYFNGKMRQGLWSDIADAPAHINVKELMVLHIFLRDFLPLSGLFPLADPQHNRNVLHPERCCYSISPSPLPSLSDTFVGAPALCEDSSNLHFVGGKPTRQCSFLVSSFTGLASSGRDFLEDRFTLSQRLNCLRQQHWQKWIVSMPGKILQRRRH